MSHRRHGRARLPLPTVTAACGLGARLRDRVWQLGRRSLLFDLGSTALICAIGLIHVWVLGGPLAQTYAKLGSPMTWSPTLAVIGIVGTTAPLAMRRLYPVATLLVVTAAYTVIGFESVPEFIASSIALLIVVYTVGAYAPRFAIGSRMFHLTIITAIMVYRLAQADYSGFSELDPGELTLFAFFANTSNVMTTVIAFAFAWILGDTVRRSRQRQAELAVRTAELAAANDTIARQAVADERLRIARELHDVVAHHVSVMGLQAGAARMILDRDPDAAVRSLRVVEETGRRAVDELQRLLGMLRAGAHPRDVHASGGHGSPQPTMSDLVELIERMRSTGLDVRVRISGSAPELPAGVELSVYRVVQEALTNALKHAGSNAQVDVKLEYTHEQLTVVVRSMAAPGAVMRRNSSPATAGRGLIGMQERVGMHGGQLRTNALGDGGFEVLATIPV
jgi:signal transduction histidine kinase